MSRRRLIDSSRNVARVMENLRRKGDAAINAAKSALKDGVDKIVADAKTRAPVKTGKLRDSIVAESTHDGAIYKIKAKESYAQYVEYDPRIAKPFLYPAIDANISALNDALKNALSQSLNR